MDVVDHRTFVEQMLKEMTQVFMDALPLLSLSELTKMRQLYSQRLNAIEGEIKKRD